MAVQRLAEFGLRGDRGDALSDIVGCREVLNFLGRAVPTLRRKGWKIDLTGSVEPFMESLSFAAPVVRIESADAPVCLRSASCMKTARARACPRSTSSARF